MKKVFRLAAIAVTMLAVATACNNNAAEENIDTTPVVEEPAIQEPATDTTTAAPQAATTTESNTTTATAKKAEPAKVKVDVTGNKTEGKAAAIKENNTVSGKTATGTVKVTPKINPKGTATKGSVATK